MKFSKGFSNELMHFLQNAPHGCSKTEASPIRVLIKRDIIVSDMCLVWQSLIALQGLLSTCEGLWVQVSDVT